MSRIPGLSRAVGTAAGSTLALALLVCGCVFTALAGPARSNGYAFDALPGGEAEAFVRHCRFPSFGAALGDGARAGARLSRDAAQRTERARCWGSAASATMSRCGAS